MAGSIVRTKVWFCQVTDKATFWNGNSLTKLRGETITNDETTYLKKYD